MCKCPAEISVLCRMNQIASQTFGILLARGFKCIRFYLDGLLVSLCTCLLVHFRHEKQAHLSQLEMDPGRMIGMLVYTGLSYDTPRGENDWIWNEFLPSGLFVMSDTQDWNRGTFRHGPCQEVLVEYD